MPPSIRHLRPADYRVMPWKNGLGTTTEIAVHPPGAGLDDFVWRLSLADLAASGPFSTFAGVERVLLQIEGEPMELVHEGLGRRRLAPLSPYRFQGEWPTHGELTSPARDLNVMTRRARARAAVAVHDLAPGSSARLLSAAETWIVYALRGALTIRVDALDVAGATIASPDLGAHEALIVDGEAALELVTPAGAVAIVVAIAA